MKLPEIILDDRGFQQLVSEARRRIAVSCPEWTDHNVSDPGITLIEQFAWMTELTLYRLNRIPDKLHIALMELLGIRLDPAAAARTGLRFSIVEGAREAVLIPSATEVGTRRSAEEEAMIFQVEEDFSIEPLRPQAYVLERGGQVKPVAMADGLARPTGTDQLAFGNPPQPGDALHLGFASPLDRLVVRIEVDASEARGAGVDPSDPPLRWEVSAGNDEWTEAEVLKDLTGGFNFGRGTIELQLPPSSAPCVVGTQSMHWIRCRITETTPSGMTDVTYAQPPEIYAITARPVGALLPATHSAVVRNELLGISDGTPAQEFPLHARPVLPLSTGETLEVLEPGTEDWEAWEARESLVTSKETDRHFVLDLVSGEIELGPAIRSPNGAWRQYGAVPPKGARLRMTAYRQGGGLAGNVAAGTLTMLKTSLPGVDRVLNPVPAIGGIDAEELPAARLRAGMEIRSQYRAVTPDDFEFLAGEATRSVARAVCVPPKGDDPTTLRLLRRVEPANRQLSLEELIPSEEDFATVGAFLDERRLLGTELALKPVRLRGVTATVKVRATPTTSATDEELKARIEAELYRYLNPLVGGSPRGLGEGWPFGRPLNVGELFGIVDAVPGVLFVDVLRIWETDLATGKQSSEKVSSHLELAPDETIASARHMVQIAPRNG